MKRTGRILSLSNDINDTAPAIDSIANLGTRLTTIFNDDREGYAWKVIAFEPFALSIVGIGTAQKPVGLHTARPDQFENNVAFGTWVVNQSMFSNSLVGVISCDVDNKGSDFYSTITPDHMAVNHLALLYEDGEKPYYCITLEEYEITDREEIAFKLKEVSQNVGDRY
tara:strand:+ start:614 stop:1117 length:504 start_codon:yes stop_codon:yes gene_type:complete